jgi:hypothetical protein
VAADFATSFLRWEMGSVLWTLTRHQSLMVSRPHLHLPRQATETYRHHPDHRQVAQAPTFIRHHSLHDRSHLPSQKARRKVRGHCASRRLSTSFAQGQGGWCLYVSVACLGRWRCGRLTMRDWCRVNVHNLRRVSYRDLAVSSCTVQLELAGSKGIPVPTFIETGHLNLQIASTRSGRSSGVTPRA